MHRLSMTSTISLSGAEASPDNGGSAECFVNTTGISEYLLAACHLARNRGQSEISEKKRCECLAATRTPESLICRSRSPGVCPLALDPLALCRNPPASKLRSRELREHDNAPRDGGYAATRAHGVNLLDAFFESQ